MLLSALLLLLLVAGRCSRLELVGRSLKTRTETETRTGTRTETETRTGTRTETETRTENWTENRNRTETRTENWTETRTENWTETGRDGVKSLERERRSDLGLEAPPRDPRHKEKFINHLTGPLNFNPKCRKHFYRLYHSTRDCTIPAYYKRCARLLTRLASSPRCAKT